MPMMDDKRLFVCWGLLGPPLVLSALLLCVVCGSVPDVSDPCASAGESLYHPACFNHSAAAAACGVCV